MKKKKLKKFKLRRPVQKLCNKVFKSLKEYDRKREKKVNKDEY